MNDIGRITASPILIRITVRTYVADNVVEEDAQDNMRLNL